MQFAAFFSRSMMVSSGLAGAHVQPCPRIKFCFVLSTLYLLVIPSEARNPGFAGSGKR